METNGLLDTTTNSITHSGNLTWDDVTPGNSLSWDEYTSWATYSGSAYGGAVGTPLFYQTAIIDLGSTKTGYAEINYDANSTIKVVIETGDASDLSDATFQSKYTTDNTVNGTVTTHTWLNYYEEGYCDDLPTTFTGRYIRITAFIELFETLTARALTTLNNLNWAVKTDKTTQTLEDIDTSSLSGTADARVLPLTDVGAPTVLIITSHSESGKVLIPQIVSKTNKTIRVIDAASGATSSVDATIDAYAEGYPGVFNVDENGILLIK